MADITQLAAPGLVIKPARVQSHQLQIQAIVTCDCGWKAPFLVSALITPGVDKPQRCPGCGQAYVIASVEYRNVNGDISLNSQLATVGSPKTAQARPIEFMHGGPHGRV